MRVITLSDGSAWPRPALESDEVYGIGHRLRHGVLSDDDLMEAAAIIDAYGYLVVESTRERRDFVCREIRAALSQGQETRS